MSLATPPLQPAAMLRAGRRRSWIYVGLAVLMSAMALRGFWPSYYGPLLDGGVARHWVIHLHGAVFAGWLALLVAQVVLAASGKLRYHRRLGSVGIGYGVVVLALGLAITFIGPVINIRSGAWSLDDAAGFLLLPLVDMLLFAGFFAAAIAYRGKPAVHKRMMLAAAVALVFPAVARMMDGEPLPTLLLWLSPLLLAMARDLVTGRAGYALHGLSILVLAAAFMRVFFLEAEPWLRIGRALLAPLV